MILRRAEFFGAEELGFGVGRVGRGLWREIVRALRFRGGIRSREGGGTLGEREALTFYSYNITRSSFQINQNLSGRQKCI